MGKLPFKKGTHGKSSNLLREDKALDRVALEPKDIRRLCILRGVYPKIMPKEKNSPWAYFHKKDLQMINSDDMAWFIREHDSWLKHHKKSFNRKEMDGRVEPTAPYDKLIRSRFPSFSDAVKELDDALTTVALFAQMSGNDLIDSQRVLHCRQLMAEFHYYVSRAKLLSKGFISVRGFHFEAMIDGIPVVWLVPHNFTLAKDSEVDYAVLLNFLELYEHLIGFINARLFIKMNLKYPAVFDNEKWNNGFYIDSIIDTQTKEEEEEPEQPVGENKEADEASEKVKNAFASVASNIEPEQEVEQESNLNPFSKFVFTLGREVPRDPIAFVIRALGGEIVWNETSNDSRITHTICDRKTITTRVLTRTYVQPQWVIDCLNKVEAIPPESYAPGEALPPHLSPWDKLPNADAELAEAVNDEREIEAGGDDSDIEITEEIRRIALETEFAEGMAQELKPEAETTDNKVVLEKLKADLKQKKKEERAKLIAGTLPAKKNKLYHEMKAKEDQKLKSKKGKIEEDPDTLPVDQNEMDEEEEE